ncbi:MAG: hypothetical protein Q7R51_00455 [bacterium]|nr:hypothetical protein [bacterium]
MRTLAGLIFIIFGILFTIPQIAKAMIIFGNEINGRKTEISSTTMVATTMSGIVGILIGLALLFGLIGGEY